MLLENVFFVLAMAGIAILLCISTCIWVDYAKKKKQRPKKTLADIYGKLKRGIDGLEYQKAMRSE
jgi:hypothetical protein